MGIIKTIIVWIEEKNLIWYGHVKTMSEQKWPKKLMRWIPLENRKKGRPTKKINGLGHKKINECKRSLWWSLQQSR